MIHLLLFKKKLNHLLIDIYTKTFYLFQISLLSLKLCDTFQQANSLMDHFFLPAHLLQNIPVFTIDYSMILFTIVDSFNFVPQFAVQFIHFSLIDCHDSTTLLLN